jgi:predicted TPR repeat methyltransferase
VAPFQNVIAATFLSARMPKEGRILDAGCGTGLFGVVFKAMRRLNAPTLIGCDIFAPYLKAIPKGIYDDLVCCDSAHLPFRNKAFSGVVAVEVIEHLDKIRGARALKEFERVSCCIIGLSTPKGYRIRSCEDGNPFQSHLSGWNVNEFRRLGFKVRFLPDMSSKLWIFVPFVLIYLTGSWAKTIICIKTIH